MPFREGTGGEICQDPVLAVKPEAGPRGLDGAELAALVDRARRGERSAFEALVRHTQGRILRLCLRMLGGSVEAQDVTQETFVKAFTQLGQLDPGRSPLPWLTTVATRLCLNRLRAQKRFEDWDDSIEPVDPLGGEDSQWLRREDQARVHQAILGLPETPRAVVVLFYVEEWNCRQIGEALGLTESNVKVHLHRAREKLRKRLCP